MPSVRMGDINCYYEVQGEGTPLMMIAGLASDSGTWRFMINDIKEHFQVIIFDNRGVGRTQCPEGPFDIAVLAEDAVKLLDHLGIESAHILGHSMGGYIAQEIAIGYPEKVSKLILGSTAAFTTERNKLLFANMLEMAEKGVPDEIITKEFMWWLFTPEYFKDKEKVEEYIKYVVNYPYPQTVYDFRRQVEVYSNYNSLDRLDRIKAGTLVIAGEKDILITRDETEMLAGKIPGARVKYIKGAHSVQVEAPGDFTGAIMGA